MSRSNKSSPSSRRENSDSGTPLTTPKNGTPNSIQVALEFKVDLSLLHRQKRALIALYEGAQVSSEQEDAAEGLLNMIDFIQDSILEQRLATEQEIFPRFPSK